MTLLEDIVHLILAFGVGQGLFIGILFYSQAKSKKDARIYLAGGIITISITLIYWISYWREIHDPPIVEGLKILVDRFDYLLAPFIYLYAVTRIDEKRGFRKVDWLHFLPFLIFLPFGINVVWYYSLGWSFFDFSNVPGLGKYINLIYNYGKLVHWSLYCFLLFRAWSIFKLAWLKKALLAMCIYTAGRLVYFTFSQIDMMPLEVDYIISFICIGAIYSISYDSFINPKVYEVVKRYKNSSLDNRHESILALEIQQYVDDQKAFTNPEFSLDQLSAALNSSRHHISQTINHHLGKTFTEFLNEKRVAYAKKLLSDPENEKAKLVAIALDAGFNNKVSFHQHFKRLTGLTPADYRKQKMDEIAELS